MSTESRTPVAALHAPSLPLHGRRLIEASAGTGKTWTIAALYLRLVLEAALPVEKILVVTYTNAATAELRARIRQRLLEAQRAYASGEAGEDEVLQALFERVPVDRAQTLLRLALESFDLAAIHTIHGFCQRALAESAFESALPFTAELASDDRRVLHEAMEDFWRREVVAGSDRRWLGWLLNEVNGPDVLLAQLAPHFGKPWLLQIGPPAIRDAESAKVFEQTIERVRPLWQRDRDAAMELLQTHGGLHKSFYKPVALEALVARVDAWFAQSQPGLPMPKHLERLTPDFIVRKTGKKHVPPEHALFAAMAELAEAADRLELDYRARLGELLQRALRDCEINVRTTRQRLGTRSFDDLLLDLHAALAGARGGRLAAALRQRYAAALIDEFQDTDPLQYGIFSTIFISSVPAGQDRSTQQAGLGFCAFVGDPKQAIYSFRGADLRAYLDARAQSGEPLALDINRRSTPALIEAINALFGRRLNPFLDGELEFEPVRAAPNAPGPLIVRGKEMPALDLWFVPRTAAEAGSKSGLINKNRAMPAIAAAVANSIAELLSAAAHGEARAGDKALAAQDIAVLVKTHYQGQLIKDALLELGIASVHYGQDSVFDSMDAVEVERVLLAIANPSRDGLVRAALATDLMGVRGDELAALDGNAWLNRLEDFHRWHALAREHGFIRMWSRWRRDADVAQRLLALPDGERRMTNLLHLTDCLAEIANADGLNIDALAKYLADARHDMRGESDTGEGRLLRLESDENLVRIVTIHAAKGLEYAVTYCPFLWDARLRDLYAPVRYHALEHGERAVLDFGSPDFETHCRLAECEMLEEALRLAYVALTRAKQHCVLAWGAIKDAEYAPLAWLLHARECVNFAELDDAAVRAGLENFAAVSPHIRVTDLQVPDAVEIEPQGGATALAARPWPQRGLQPWRMHSFSAWLTDANERTSDSDELPDYDALALSGVDEVVAPEVSLFPAGANAGTCLHAIFEHADFAAPEAGTFASALAEFGFEPRLQAAAEKLVGDSLRTPMGATLPALTAVPRAHQIREMEFMLPVSAPEMAALANAVGKQAGADGKLDQRIFALKPAHLAGFLKGFIDLVFMHEDRWYVLDYKSNHLGPAMADYAEPRLAAAMAEAMYDLQALLYCVALHLALKQRLANYDYERHCGGSVYLFLRGMQPAVAGSGVFAWRPDAAMIERVAACLAPKQKVMATC